MGYSQSRRSESRWRSERSSASALWFYNHPGLYLPCLAPLLALNSNVLFCLVSDFAFARIEKAKLRSTLEKRDDLTHMIVHDLRSPLFSPLLKNRTLHCEVPPEPVVISCDADVIRRVLENLISNALKFTRPDGTICVDVEPDDGEVTISVRDDGEGIPSDQRERVFEKFGQVNGGGENRHSTGLGLAFCGLAVEAHQGKIGLHSEVGKGSTFWFKLPATVSTLNKNGNVNDRNLVARS